VRLLLDLREITDPEKRRRLAAEADENGIWGVVVTGPRGGESVEASVIATATTNITIAVDVDIDGVHSTTVAEEISVLDQISRRRTMVIFRGNPSAAKPIQELLSGKDVDGVILSPPPAQAAIPVHESSEISTVNLPSDIGEAASVIDQHRDAGDRFLIVASHQPVKEIARHFLGRAVSADFPQMVADMADQIDPINQ